MVIARALTIAGSDSGGGAGIQADIKTFQELGVFGMSAITVLTAQNTLGVQGVYPQSVECIAEQLDSVLSDIGADAVKTGMLYSADIIEIVAEKLSAHGRPTLVVDPVMFAKGGTPLLKQEAMDALRTKLLPLATLITPNIPEACELVGAKEITCVEQMERAAKQLHELGSKYVLVKGGHLEGPSSVDVLYDGQSFLHLESRRIPTNHTHGTGCTLSAAIAAQLAKGDSIQSAVQTAKAFITAAIDHALPIGGGIGPTNHAAYRSCQ